MTLADDFGTFQQELFDQALEAADRAAELRREAEYMAQHGSWGVHREQEAIDQETCFGLSDTSKLDQLDQLTEEFHNHIHALLRTLDRKLNGSRPAWEEDHDFVTRTTTPTTSSPFKSTGITHEATSTTSWDGTSSTWSLAAEVGRDDLDSLRFLASQLDHNKYYGVTNL